MKSLITALPLFIWEIISSLIRANPSYLAIKIRKFLNKTTCFIDTNVVITNYKNFYANIGSSLYHGCYILNHYGIFKLGRNSHLGAFCYVNVCYGNIEIGNDVAIGPGTKIISYSNHYQRGKKITEIRLIGDVIIGNNVFIGANCSILPNTTISNNVIIAAGSVVKGKLEENAIYGGAPCRVIQKGWYE